MTLSILADENIPAVEHYAGKLASVQRFRGRELRAGQLAGVDVLLVRSVTRVDQALLGDTPLRFVGTATSGVDHIDRDYLSRRGIGFANAPGSNANSVVEYVLAVIAVIGDTLERLLAGGSVGIVGYGVIGKAVAARLRALHIDYRIYDPWLQQTGIDNCADLATVMACDVVTLHPELTREQPWPSYHLLDTAALAGLQRHGTVLINASRGAVVDNRALLALLAQGGGPRTALDVWEGEPAINHELLGRVEIGTPHIAGYSLDGKLLGTAMLFQSLADHLNLHWRSPASPAGEALPLEAPLALEGSQLIRHLLLSRYDIARDDAALRDATLGRDVTAAAVDFDRLRRSYAPRRELLGSRVRRAHFSVSDRALLAGLGCNVETGSEQG